MQERKGAKEGKDYPKMRFNNQVTNDASKPRKKNRKPRNGCMSISLTFKVKVVKINDATNP